MWESSAHATLIGLAESPSLVLPREPGGEVLHRDGYALALRPTWATVEEIRLGDVERVVVEIGSIIRERSLSHVNWWAGVQSTPGDLVEQLVSLGLEPDPEMPSARTLVLETPPAGVPRVEVRPVEDVDGYILTRQIAGAVWPDPKGDEQAWRSWWPLLAANEASQFHLAYVDGEAVGFSRTVFTPLAALLMGGAVLPNARGRGAYVSLVHARWREAVRRGVPRLLVGAGPMSAPILERLGFTPIGSIRVLRQQL